MLRLRNLEMAAAAPYSCASSPILTLFKANELTNRVR
jgi:hypothetical protein